MTHPQEEAQRRIGKRRGIHYYASVGNSELVELHILADQSALNAQNSRTFSSVLYKANGRVEVVKQLIEWRVDLEAKDYSGWTALHIAALAGRHAETRMLIEARADVNAKTK